MLSTCADYDYPGEWRIAALMSQVPSNEETASVYFLYHLRLLSDRIHPLIPGW